MTHFFVKIFYTYQHSLTCRILADSVSLFQRLWFWVVIGVAAVSLVRSVIPKSRMILFFKKRSNVSIAAAALAGVFLPFGTYTVIPLAAALVPLGIPIAPLIAFVIAAPLIDPNLFFLTAGAMGFPLAVLRVVSALLLGLAGGYAARILFGTEGLGQHVADSSKGIKPEPDRGRPQERIGPTLKTVGTTVLQQTLTIGKFFILGIFAAAVVKHAVSPDWVMRVLGKNSFVSVLTATGAGIPLYSCGGASIPVMQQLSELGMSKGAVLAFFISGPAVKVSTLVLMKSAFSTKVCLLYVAVTITGAIGFGLAYNLLG